MRYTRIFVDELRDSHFDEVGVETASVEFAPPAPAMDLSAWMTTTRVGFLGAPAGWFGQPHPSPRRQFVICLEGEADVQVSDREVRRFAPGHIWLLEDTTGKGHSTRVMGDSYWQIAVVQLPD
jgi:hypothetical protein